MGANAEPCHVSLSRALVQRNREILEQLPQVHSIAQRIHARLPRHVQLDDLVNTGVLGLIDALGKFDRGRKVELKSYATHRIRGAILDSLREQDWGPRQLRQKGRRIEEARQKLIGRLGRAPSCTELAREMSLSEEKLNALLNDLRGLCISSLQGASRTEDQELGETLTSPGGETPFELCRRAEMNALVERASAGLPARQRRILRLYYFEGLTMKEIGARLGVCESRISQMHTATLETLRNKLSRILQPDSSHKP